MSLLANLFPVISIDFVFLAFMVILFVLDHRTMLFKSDCSADFTAAGALSTSAESSVICVYVDLGVEYL